MKIADYIERKRHGSPDFPIQYYYVDSENPQYKMLAHWHKEFEIIRVIQGEFEVFLNSVSYILHGGDILLIESGCLHRGEPKNSIYECLVFDINMLKRQQNDAAERFISPIASASVGLNCFIDGKQKLIPDTVAELFDKMRREEEFYELEVYSLLFKLFAMLYTEKYILPKSDIPHSRQAKTVTELLNWIDENFTEQITLERLSSLSGLSKKYICRIFKEYTSKTVVSYINELRVENACYEMLEKGKSVTESAFDSGFNDLSYFCKTFKKYKGITPNEFKRC